jgi:hypothetical protein
VPGEKKVVYLTDAKLDAPAPKPGMTVEDRADEIVISTGAAVFAVSKKAFGFLKSAVVGGEELLDGSADLGLVIEDTYGEKYYGADGVKSVAVQESDPVRVCIRAQGRNLARGGKGYSRGMYGYDVFMNFYAGSSDVFADVVVTNNPAKSIGSPTFEDASLLLKLKGGAGGCALWGEKPTEGRLAVGDSVSLYQDSNGADTWEHCTGFGDMDTKGWSELSTKIASFRGYKVWRRAGGKEEELAAGSQARGLMHASNDRGGVIVHTRNFWQQFPKAVEVSADGTVRVGLFPRECRVPHYLEDASAKGHEIILHFYNAKAKGAYESGPDGRPQPSAVMAAWDVPALPRPELKHMAACGALSDLGPYTPPTRGLDKKPGDRVAANCSRMLTADELYGNAYGWQVFGERWRSNGGHGTHGARQPINEDNYLYLYYLTGLPEWLAAGDARSRQFRDVRAYRVDDQDALGFKDWDGFRKANTRERASGGCARPIPKDEELKKYQQGFWPRSPWEFPNREHTTIDLLYDRYLLFGDTRAFENMRVVAGHGGYYAISAGPQIGRHTGWSWRAFHRYWELTGDKRADELMKQLIKAYEPLIGKAPLWFGNDEMAHASDWFTQIFSRAAAMTALDTGDPKALEICKSLAEGKEKPRAGSLTYGKQSPTDASYFSTLFAVLYRLTGEEKYKEPLAKALGGDGLLSVGGYFPASDHWLLHQPQIPRRSDK